jgi:hypothetical protein
MRTVLFSLPCEARHVIYTGHTFTSNFTCNLTAARVSVVFSLPREAGQGRAGQGRAGQGRVGQGRAGQGRTHHIHRYELNLYTTN